jgi:hypothetical protein
MNPLSMYFYAENFKKFCREKKGTEFEAFFVDIMKKVYQDDFIACKPWGRVGDRKNDGYLTTERRLFAVNAPERIEIPRLLNKIESDFNGALPHWEGYFDKWTFVHNQHEFPPQIIEKFLQLKDEYSEKIDIDNWGPETLRRMVFDLDEILIDDLLGPIPSTNEFVHISFEDIQPIIKAISRQSIPIEAPLIPVPENKLVINGLSEQIIGLIKHSLSRASLVSQYFRMNPEVGLGDKIAGTLSNKYIYLRDNKSLYPDDIYDELVNFISDDSKHDTKYVVAVHIVLAYFFEQCTVFEG